MYIKNFIEAINFWPEVEEFDYDEERTNVEWIYFKMNGVYFAGHVEETETGEKITWGHYGPGLSENAYDHYHTLFGNFCAGIKSRKAVSCEFEF